MIYVVTFSLAAMIVAMRREFSLKVKGHEKKITIGLLLSCILLAALAGLRAELIGTDIKTYVLYTFTKVQKFSVISEVKENVQFELFYEMLAYIVSRFTNDVHWFHFATEMIICGGTIIFISKFKDKAWMALSLLCFCFLYYNQTLNLMRQWIAMGICMIAYRYMVDKKWVPCLFFASLSVLFHSSAVIAFVVIAIYILLENGKFDTRRILLIVGCISLVVLCFAPVLKAAIAIGVLPEKYNNYFIWEFGKASLLSQVIVRMPVLILILLLYRELVEYDVRNKCFITYIIIDFLLGLLSPQFGYVTRVATYFGLWQIILIPEMFNVAQAKTNKNWQKALILVGFVLLLFGYWFYNYPLRNFSETCPYESDVWSVLNWQI